MYQLSLCVFLVVELLKHNGPITAAFTGFSEHHSYRSLPWHLLTSSPHGLATIHWSGVSDIAACAFKALSSCSGSRGFLYSPDSKICIPLLWLQVGSGGGTTFGNVDLQQWNLFVTSGLCQTGFDAYDYSEEGDFMCLKRLTFSQTYMDATAECNNQGGYLASIKTVDELEIIKTLSNSIDHWVGMDDLVKEGVHSWQEDGQQLTSQQQQHVLNLASPTTTVAMRIVCTTGSPTNSSTTTTAGPRNHLSVRASRSVALVDFFFKTCQRL